MIYRSHKRYVFRFLLKHSKVGLFLRQAVISLFREFHRFADALKKLVDPYLSGFPGGTVSKFDSADLSTLPSRIRHNQFTKIPRHQAMQCFIRI